LKLHLKHFQLLNLLHLNILSDEVELSPEEIEAVSESVNNFINTTHNKEDSDAEDLTVESVSNEVSTEQVKENGVAEEIVGDESAEELKIEQKAAEHVSEDHDSSEKVEEEA
jgi:hypothetical protein